MIPMMVRTVDHDVRSGGAVAMLLPRDPGAAPPMALPIQPAEACSLSHELERHATPRTRAYALLAQTLAAIGGYVSAIVVEPGPDRGVVARVQVGLNARTSEHPLDISSALGLAVYASLPVLVSEQLIKPAGSLRTSDGEPMAHVPAQFRRALDE